jgi:hypothetical protein
MYQYEASDKDNFDNFWSEVILKKFPKAKIAFKTDSNLMGFLGWFSRAFYQGLTTVIGNTIYFPSKEFLEKNYKNSYCTLAHEFVHMVDKKNEPFLMFEVKYLFPQILAIFSFLSFFAYISLWFFLFLLFLIFLVPGIPSPWRVYYEANAYAMNFFVAYKGSEFNPVLEDVANAMAELLTGREYWYASRDRQLVTSMIKDRYERLPDEHEAFIEVKKWLGLMS